MGTPDFISPEQAADARSADIRSDIYSLGCTLYYLLAGQPPFTAGTAMERVKAHGELEPTPIATVRGDIPQKLANTLSRMMAKEPAERFETPAQVADALRPFVHDARTEQGSISNAISARRTFQRMRHLAFAVAFAVVLGAVGVLIQFATGERTLVIQPDGQGVDPAAVGETAPTAKSNVPPSEALDPAAPLIKAVVARFDALRSGSMTYNVTRRIKDTTLADGQFTFVFDGDDWRLNQTTDARGIVESRIEINHDGRRIDYLKSARGSSRVGIHPVQSPLFAHRVWPPVRAGTVWFSKTHKYLAKHAQAVRLVRVQKINDIESQVVELAVPARDVDAAFHSIAQPLRGGGSLRLYVAPQLGHAVVRVEHVDQHGLVQGLMDYANFTEVAPGIFFPLKTQVTKGSVTHYVVHGVEKANEPIPDQAFAPDFPPANSVQDYRERLEQPGTNCGDRETASQTDAAADTFRIESWADEDMLDKQSVQRILDTARWINDNRAQRMVSGAVAFRSTVTPRRAEQATTTTGSLYFDRRQFRVDAAVQQERSETPCQLLWTEQWCARLVSGDDTIRIWELPGDPRQATYDPRLLSTPYVGDLDRLAVQKIVYENRPCFRLEELHSLSAVRAVTILDAARDLRMLRRESYYENSFGSRGRELREDVPFQTTSLEYRQDDGTGLWQLATYSEQRFESVPLAAKREPAKTLEVLIEFWDYALKKPPRERFALRDIGRAGKARRLRDNRQGPDQGGWFQLPPPGNLLAPAALRMTPELPTDLQAAWD